MCKELVRLTNIEVGGFFKRLNVIYKKTAYKKGYLGNAIRMDNGKVYYFNNNILVEKV